MMEQTAYATATPVLYELSGVEKSCEGPAERITILKNMDLTVRAGESLAIVGASGSGKSTLLHLLGALDTPTAGKVLFEGKSLPDMTPVEKPISATKSLGSSSSSTTCCPSFPPRKMWPCRRSSPG